MSVSTRVRIMIPTKNLGNLNRQAFYMNRSTQSKANRELAKAAAVHQKAGQMPEGSLVHLDVEIGFPDRRARDLDNLVIKPLIDGFVDAGIIADDRYQILASVTRRRSTKRTQVGMIRLDFTFTSRSQDRLPDGFLDGDDDADFMDEELCLYDDEFADPYSACAAAEEPVPHAPDWATLMSSKGATQAHSTPDVVLESAAARLTVPKPLWEVPAGTDCQVGDGVIDILNVVSKTSGLRIFEESPADHEMDWSDLTSTSTLVDADEYLLKLIYDGVARVLTLPDWSRSMLNLKTFEAEVLFNDPEASLSVFSSRVLPVLGVRKASGGEVGVFVKRATANTVAEPLRELLRRRYEEKSVSLVDEDDMSLDAELVVAGELQF